MAWTPLDANSHTRLWEHFNNVAAAGPVVATGNTTINITGNAAGQTVALPVGKFTAAPVVVASIGSDAPVAYSSTVIVHTVTTASFVLRLQLAPGNNGAGDPVVLRWIAIQVV